MLCSPRCGQCWCLLSFLFCNLGAGFEAIAVVAGLQDVAAVGEPIEEGGGAMRMQREGVPNDVVARVLETALRTLILGARPLGVRPKAAICKI